MRHRGQAAHPEVQVAIDAAIRTIVASGKAAGALTTDPALARHYVALGASFVAVGIDITLLAIRPRHRRGDGRRRRLGLLRRHHA